MLEEDIIEAKKKEIKTLVNSLDDPVLKTILSKMLELV